MMSLLLWGSFSLGIGIVVLGFDISIQRLALAISVVLERMDAS